AQQELPALQAYFKLVGTMPRDIELDDKVLLTTFARAFGAVNADGSLNRTRLDSLAARWFNFIDKEVLHGAETLDKKIREASAKATCPAAPTSGPGTGGFGNFAGSFTGSPLLPGGPNTGNPPRPGGATGNPPRPGGSNTGAPPRPGGAPPRPGGR